MIDTSTCGPASVVSFTSFFGSKILFIVHIFFFFCVFLLFNVSKAIAWICVKLNSTFFLLTFRMVLWSHFMKGDTYYKNLLVSERIQINFCFLVWAFMILFWLITIGLMVHSLIFDILNWITYCSLVRIRTWFWLCVLVSTSSKFAPSFVSIRL